MQGFFPFSIPSQALYGQKPRFPDLTGGHFSLNFNPLLADFVSTGPFKSVSAAFYVQPNNTEKHEKTRFSAKKHAFQEGGAIFAHPSFLPGPVIQFGQTMEFTDFTDKIRRARIR